MRYSHRVVHTLRDHGRPMTVVQIAEASRLPLRVVKNVIFNRNHRQVRVARLIELAGVLENEFGKPGLYQIRPTGTADWTWTTEHEIEVAKSALTDPTLYEEGREMIAAQRAMQEARDKIRKARRNWRKLVAPAVGFKKDPFEGWRQK